MLKPKHERKDYDHIMELGVRGILKAADPGPRQVRYADGADPVGDSFRDMLKIEAKKK